MKKIFLLTTISICSTCIFAQKYDDIKGALAIGQIAKAKEAFDKSASNEKFFNKPEGYLIKAAIFAGLSLDSSKAADADKNRSDADAAFQKYKELEPDLKQLEDPIYKNVPFSLYASYYNAGVADINSKNYDPAYEKLKKTVDYSDLLISKKIMDKPVDTSAVYYAGALSEQTKHPEDVLKFYGRLADKKIAGPSYESVYQGLVRYYAAKNDKDNFEKYKALGKELYPQTDFFNYDLTDFAVGAGGSFNDKIANLEKLIAGNPNDYKTNLALGETIFDTLRKEHGFQPAQQEELETKMINALNKTKSINPNEMQPLLLLGDFYFNKSQKLSDDMRPIETELVKKGAKASAADKQKLAEIKKKYDAAYDLTKDNYELAAAMFSKIQNLNINQKRQYKIIAGNLAEYYAYKQREGAKGANYAALEKKYNDIYEALRK